MTQGHRLTLADATHVLDHGGLTPISRWEQLVRAIEQSKLPIPARKRIVNLARSFIRHKPYHDFWPVTKL